MSECERLINDAISMYYDKKIPFKKCLKTLKKALKKCPDNTRALAWYAVTLIAMAKMERRRNPEGKKWRKQLDEGIKSLKEAVSKNPLVLAEEKLAEQAVMELDNFPIDELTVELLDKALQYNPQSYSLTFLKAHMFDKQGKVEEAMKWCKKAMSLSKGDLSAKGLYCTLLAEIGRGEEALAMIDECIEKHPDDLMLYRVKATILIKMERYEECIDVVDRALSNVKEIDTIVIDLLKRKAIALEKLRRYHFAVEVYRKILRYYPDDTFALFRLGHILTFVLCKFKEAIPYLLTASELDDDPDIFYMLAHAYMMINEVKMAAVAINVALNKDPNNPRYKLKAAQILEYLGKLNEAYEYYKESLDLFSDASGKAAAISGIADILALKGRYDEALQYHKKAVHLNPSSAFLRFYLADILEKMKRYKEALEQYKIALELSNNDYYRNYALRKIKQLERLVRG